MSPPCVDKSGAHLHVVHHELVGELAPVLRVHHLLVHQAVDDGDAAVRAERLRDLLQKKEERTTIMNESNVLCFIKWKYYRYTA